MRSALARRVLAIGSVALFLGAASAAFAGTPREQWPGLPHEFSKKSPPVYVSASQDSPHQFRRSREVRPVLRYTKTLEVGGASMVLRLRARLKPRSVLKFELVF